MKLILLGIYLLVKTCLCDLEYTNVDIIPDGDLIRNDLKAIESKSYA